MLILLTFISSVFSGCSWTVGGKHYDLSGLNGKVAEGKDTKISTYSYHAAVCSDMTEVCEDIMTGDHLKGIVYQLGGEPGSQQVCWDVLAKWDEGNLQASTLDDSAGASGKDGITLSFSNGDNCRGSPRKTKMNFICDSAELGELEGAQDGTDSCLFIINIPTKHGCSGAAPAGTTTSGGISGGWVFIIILFSLAIFYVAGFFVYAAYPEKEFKNVQHCVCMSHLDYYKRFLGYVKDGCQISYNMTLNGIQWVIAKIRKEPSSDAEGEETGTGDDY